MTSAFTEKGKLSSFRGEVQFKVLKRPIADQLVDVTEVIRHPVQTSWNRIFHDGAHSDSHLDHSVCGWVDSRQSPWTVVYINKQQIRKFLGMGEGVLVV